MEKLKKQISEQGNQSSALMPSILNVLNSSLTGSEGSILASAMLQPQNVIAITGIDAEENKYVYVNDNAESLSDDSSYIFQGKIYSAGDISEEEGIKPMMDGESTMIVQCSTSDTSFSLGIKLENAVLKTGVGYSHAKTLRPTCFNGLSMSGLSSFTFEHDTYVSSLHGDAPRDVLHVKNCRLEFDMGLSNTSFSSLKAFVVKNGYITENTSNNWWLRHVNRLKYVVLDMDPLRITEVGPEDAKIETLFKDDTIDSLPKTGKLYYNPAYNWPELIKNLPEGWEVYNYIPSDEEIEEAIAPLLRAPHE